MQITMTKMNKKHIWLETEYLRNAGETIEACIINGERIIYVHYENGYYSLIEGIKNLMNFLNGDTSERFACCETMNDVFVELDRLD